MAISGPNALRITDMISSEHRDHARAKDKNEDGRIQRSEVSADDFAALSTSVAAQSRNAGWAAGLTSLFAVATPTLVETATKFAHLGGIWGAVFTGIGSGSRNISAASRGEISATRALFDTVEDAAISAGAGAAGAAIGGAVGTVVPVAGTIVGTIVGAGSGYMLNRAAHGLLDYAG